VKRTRRAFLTAVGSGGIAMLSGCSGSRLLGDDRQTPVEPDPIVVDGEVGVPDGPGTADDPYDTIIRGLKAAEPGDTVYVRSGVYREQVRTPHGGEPGEPITITGPPDAVLTSDADRRKPLVIHDSHVHLRGLTVNGLWNPDRPDDPESYARSPLIFPSPRPDDDAYVEDLVIAPHGLGNARAHMISTRRVRDVEIGPLEVIGPAGTYYFLDEETEGHVGEIVYLGTPVSTYEADHYYWEGLDASRDIHVHHVDNSAGHRHGEMINTKPGTHDVLVEYCTDGGGSANDDDAFRSASMRLQGHGTTVRWCDLRNDENIGIELLGGYDEWFDEEWDDPPVDADDIGTGYEIYGNRLRGFDTSLRFRWVDATKQIICGNELESEPTYEGVPESARRPADSYAAACHADLPDGDGVGHNGG